MKSLRLAATIALLIFVGVTVGMLVAQEISLAQATNQSSPAGQEPGRLEDSDGASDGLGSRDSSPTAVASVAESDGADAMDVSPDNSDSSDPNAVDGEDAAQIAISSHAEPETGEAENAAPGDADASIPRAPAEDAAAEDVPPCSVRALYFHNTHRCYTCLKIEETAKSIMESEFPRAFSESRLEWLSINMEEQHHYIADYDLSMPTLVLARFVGGEEQEWVALTETWSLIRSDVRFATYIADNVRAFLGACP